MEDGSLRCDANVSIRPVGETKLGTKTEIKNMNSFKSVQKAIDYEIERQIESVLKGNKIIQETRLYDEAKNITLTMRKKEEAFDYRYFPEPDLQPVFITKDYIAGVQKDLPTLPNELHKLYTETYKLSAYDAGQIIESKEIALYFNELLKHTSNFKSAANWIMGPVGSFLNERAMHFSEFGLVPAKIAEIIALIDAGKISNSAAAQHVFPALVANPSASAEETAAKLDLIQNSDSGELQSMVDAVLSKFPDKIAEYKNGKTGLLGLFVGEVMKLSKGKADPKVLNKLVKEALDK